MKQLIIENIDKPEILEKLYRSNKQDFRKSFAEISDDYQTELVRYWKIRLSFETKTESAKIIRSELLVIIALSVLSVILIKLPSIFPGIEMKSFYQRNTAIIVFNGIILYNLWQNSFFNKKHLFFYGLTLLILTLFINLLPSDKSDTSTLSFIHVPLFLWCLWGFTFIYFDIHRISRLIDFIKLSGELLIMTGLILSAWSLFSGISLQLFSAIKTDIHQFFADYIMIPGAVVAPIVSYYLVRLYPDLTSKIPPVIAKIFTPLVLVSLVIYLISLFYLGIPVLEDRERLIVFNILLVAVMAVIIFSILALEKTERKNLNVFFLFSISILTIVINSIALIAIVSRALNGLTPNRTVVLISNILIFIHLILLTINLYRSGFRSNGLERAEKTITNYLPVYAFWTIIVIFILPFLFGFK